MDASAFCVARLSRHRTSEAITHATAKVSRQTEALIFNNAERNVDSFTHASLLVYESKQWVQVWTMPMQRVNIGDSL